MAYKDKNKQREAVKKATKRYRQRRQGITNKGKPEGITQTITDACGNTHPIDFEGRRKTRALLEVWAGGKGTAEQCLLGRLSETYSIINGYKKKYGETVRLTDAGRRYLGLN